MSKVDRGDSLNEAIASLPKNASFEIVVDHLDPLFHQLWSCEHDEGSNEAHTSVCNHEHGAFAPSRDASVTPLMVACDKEQLECLRYFSRKCEEIIDSSHGKNTEKIHEAVVRVGRIIGHIFDATTIDGENQAIHYATYSGINPSALDYLAAILIFQQQSCVQPESKESMTKQISFHAYSTILSQQNKHGDTPIMLAAVTGNCKLLKYWIDCIEREAGSDEGRNQDLIMKIFSLHNSDGQSALLLAAGHGHYEVVELLCTHNNKTLVQVTYQDIKITKNVISKTNAMEHRIPLDRIEEFKVQQGNIRRCLNLMQNLMERLAENAASELLSIDKVDDVSVKASTRASKMKKKRQKQKQKQKIKVALNGQKDKEIVEGTVNKSDAESLRNTKFITMEDGTIISKKNASRFMGDMLTTKSIQQTYVSNDTRSIQSMLRERCIQSQHDTNAMSQASEEVMDALGLDASMLLMSPHALAMNLSPSQLEAVEKVLMIQMDAVAQAKLIHGRLMASPSEMDGD